MDLMMILLFLVTIHFVSSEESFPFSLGDRALVGDRHSRSRAPYDYVDPYAERRFENRRSTLADRSPEYIDPRFRRRALPRFRGSVPRFGRRHQTFNPIELLRDIEMHRRSPPMEIDFELPESEDLDSSMPSPREFVKTLNSPPAFVFGRRFFGDLPSAATPILDMEKFVTDMTPEEGGIWLRNHTTGAMYTTIPVRGIDPRDIQVKISKGNMLIVSAQSSENTKIVDGHGYKVSEEDFHEEFPLPYEIDKNIRATVKNKVLKIELPPSSAAKENHVERDEDEDHSEDHSDYDEDREYEIEEEDDRDDDAVADMKLPNDIEFKKKLAPSVRATFYPSDNLPV